ncbi:MAG: sulfur carrier protein ThiS [Clostridium sp.]|nr:sulfur carrier protein ThiS [Clostridium sp.]
MKAEINKKEIEIGAEGLTLAQLLREQGFTGIGQAAAVNNRVVPKAEWENFKVKDGMKITVIRAVCGG